MRRLSALGALFAAMVVASCSSDSASATPATGGAAAGGRGAGGRVNPTITLAPSDVAEAHMGTIEEGVSLTGDLHPIESVDVRARIEGDLIGVYVREGQRVHTGDLLARFEASNQESDHQSALADRASAQSELSTAQWNAEQSGTLFKAGAISEQDMRVAQQNVVAAKARLAAAEARVSATTTAARDTRVVATTDGVVDKRDVEPGEHVAKGATMFTIVRNDVLELAAAVPARQANSVQTGQRVRFVADGRTFDGRVARVSPTIDPASRAITVYAQIPNPGGALKGGTFATGRVVSRTVTNTLLVPTTAIRQSQDNGAPFVYRIADNTLDVAPVQLGIVDERSGAAQVLSGLANGDRVIVGNVGTLGRGMKVQVLGNEAAGPGGRAGAKTSAR